MNLVKDKSIACVKNESERMLPACRESKKKKLNENKKAKDVSSKSENNHHCLALKEELNNLQVLKK